MTASPPPGERRRIVFGVLAVVFGVALGATVVLCLEGVASFYTAIRVARQDLPVAEWRYCEHDPELGWVGKPSVRVPEMFGPGRGVVTNARRFRQAAEVAQSIPAGKVRVICSGDSFTFGYGVDTEDAWCNQLSRINPWIEPVNMGQGGYGLDQSYLWYKRDGVLVEHDLHLLAFIDEGFARMEVSEELGYAKPVLTLDNGRLVLRNTPIRKRSGLWRLPGVRSTIAAFQALHLAGTARSLRSAVAGPGLLPTQDVPGVVKALVEDLAKMDREKGRLLAFVYLPTEEDCFKDTPAYLYWSAFMRDGAAHTGSIFIDLVPECRQLPAVIIDSMFISGEDTPYYNAAGHYSVEGNRFVAHKVSSALARDPRVQTLAAGRFAAPVR